jgi:hypothetical protein
MGIHVAPQVCLLCLLIGWTRAEARFNNSVAVLLLLENK